MGDGSKTLHFKPADINAVNHYLFWGIKKEAYLLSRNELNKNRTQKQIIDAAYHYFNSEKIQTLLTLESKKFKERLIALAVEHELKNFDGLNNNKIDLADHKDIDKDEAIRMIERILRNNPNDKVIAKDLIPKLSELKDWKKETISTKSNVLLYELPIKKVK